jgi:hypothetical protein
VEEDDVVCEVVEDWREVWRVGWEPAWMLDMVVRWDGQWWRWIVEQGSCVGR